jgi:hypothetical protein
MKDMKVQIDQILLENSFRYFLDSTILTTFESRKMVAEFLLQYSSKIQLTKIYKTIDGWTADQIHAKIDGQAPTITIVKTTKNKIFGGFTTMPWDKTSGYKSDTSAFTFSVDLCSKYPVNPANPANAIHCTSGWGPRFGDGAFFAIYNNSNTENSSYFGGNSVYPSSPKAANGNSAFLDGEKNFLVADMEVYKVTVVA